MLKGKKDVEVSVVQEDPNWPRELEPRLDRLQNATMDIKVVLGRTRMKLSNLSELKEGSIVETNRLSGMPFDIMVNGTLFGCGEVVVVGDNLALRVTELLKAEAMVKGYWSN